LVNYVGLKKKKRTSFIKVYIANVRPAQAKKVAENNYEIFWWILLNTEYFTFHYLYPL